MFAVFVLMFPACTSFGAEIPHTYDSACGILAKNELHAGTTQTQPGNIQTKTTKHSDKISEHSDTTREHSDKNREHLG